MILENTKIKWMNIESKQDMMPDCNPDVATVMMVRNDSVETFLSHPYFLVILLEQGPSIPINYALTWFLHAINAPSSINTRVKEARVACTVDLFCNDVASVPLSLLNVFHRATDNPPHQYAACKNCHIRARRCCCSLPCARCSSVNLECLPNDTPARVSSLFNMVLNGRVVHHDLARYILNEQASYYSVRSVDGQKGQVHVINRARDQWPPDDKKVLTSEYKDLPSCIKTMAEKYQADKAIRIQWLINGEYASSYNKEWSCNFMGPEEIKTNAKSMTCPPLLLETLGCGDNTMMYSLFVESLTFPEDEVFQKDIVYWKSMKLMRKVVVRMKTVIIDCNRVVNITIVELR
jgi:hypothetical protein